MPKQPACFTKAAHFERALNGSWKPGRAPYRPHPACPFLRPWESCAHDDPARAAAAGSRRFVPRTCVLDELNGTQAAALQRRLAGRLLLFAGDSIHVQHFVSLACILHALVPSSIQRMELEWLSPRSVTNRRVLKKRCHGVDRCHYDQGCVHFTNGMRMCLCRLEELEAAEYARCMRVFGRADVVYYGSSGIHYTGEMGPTGTSGRGERARALVETEVGLLLNATDRHPLTGRRGVNSPLVLWREVTAQHFAGVGGHYTQSSSKDNYNYKSDVPGCFSNHSKMEMQHHQKWNAYAEPLLTAARMPVVRVWESTAMAWDAHVGYGDCTHWCQPGLIDHWSRLFVSMLLRHTWEPLIGTDL